MSTISPQQIQTDRNNFQQQAQKDGLNLQQIQQQALSGLGSNATDVDKANAIQAATAQAVEKTGDQKLAQGFMTLQNDNAQMLKKGPPPGGIGGQQEDPVQKVIAEGDSATSSEIKSCLADLKDKDPRRAKLESMLQSAEQREARGDDKKPGPQPPIQGPGTSSQPGGFGFGPPGGALNFMS
jgi:hypothetical protein